MSAIVRNEKYEKMGRKRACLLRQQSISKTICDDEDDIIPHLSPASHHYFELWSIFLDTAGTNIDPKSNIRMKRTTLYPN